MATPVISVRGIGKRYKLGATLGGARYKTFRDALANAARTPIRLFKKNGGGKAGDSENPQFIWALKDLSFDVQEGEVIGIIGRNGAGKSTLLKILGQITEPTVGEIRIRGRVASLLEVGTGFHPELTGRENIFMNGAILGMSRVEIRQKFDEIVAFAEVEKFIDTPVKRYSSGMYVRLAFAVAAHLEPEILLVDEVLAVGDAAFQKKCLGKMDDVAKGGRTIFFVSHQMNSIRKLCESCLWLTDGQIRMKDSTFKTVSEYELSSMVGPSEETRKNIDANTPAQFLRWGVVNNENEDSFTVTSYDPVKFVTVLQVNRPIKNGHHGIALWNSDNQLIWAWNTSNLKLERGIHKLYYSFPSLPLRPGIYSWQVSLFEDEKTLDIWFCVPNLVIATKPVVALSDNWSGILNLPFDFSLDREELE